MTRITFIKWGDLSDDNVAPAGAVAFDGTVSYLDEIRAVARGRQCSVISIGSRRARMGIDGIDCVSIDASQSTARVLALPLAWGQVLRELSRLRPDVVVALDAGYYSLPLWWYAAHRRCRLVLAVPGQIGGPRPSDALRRATFRFVARSRQTVSVFGRGSLTTRELVAAGLDEHEVLPFFPAYDSSLLESRRAARSASGEPVEAVFLGRLAPVKGVDDLAMVADALSGVGARLTVIGDGPSGSDVREALACHVASGAAAIRGALPTADALHEVAGADMMIVPSRFEGIAKSVMESLIVGVPVVAYDVGGVSEWVKDGRNGVLVAPGDSPAFSAAVRSLAEDVPRRESMRRSAAEDGKLLLGLHPTFSEAIEGVLRSLEPRDQKVTQ